MTDTVERRYFRRASRLSNAQEFRRVFERAVRSADRAFTILACPNDLGHARLGLAISRKCAADAVARNRIKRLVRESFRLSHSRLPAVDLVVMCRPVVNAMNNRQIDAVLTRHWIRIAQQCKNPSSR